MSRHFSGSLSRPGLSHVAPETGTTVSRPIEIVVDDALAAWLEGVWPFGRCGPSFPTDGNVLTVIIRNDHALPLRDLRTNESLPGAADTRHLRIDGKEFWVWEVMESSDPSSACSVHMLVDDTGVTITAFGSPFTGWAALTNAFHEAVSLAGLVPFHAAAIHRPAFRDVSPQTWMILGPSGRGKTTTVLRALRAGWSAVAEDVCWLHPATLQVLGSDSSIGVRPPSLALLHSVLPGTRALVGGARENAKLLVPFTEFDAVRAPITLTHVVELRGRDDVGLGLSESTALRTAMALYEAAGIPRTDQARATLASTIGRLVDAMCCSALGLGSIDLPFP